MQGDFFGQNKLYLSSAPYSDSNYVPWGRFKRVLGVLGALVALGTLGQSAGPVLLVSSLQVLRLFLALRLPTRQAALHGSEPAADVLSAG